VYRLCFLGLRLAQASGMHSYFLGGPGFEAGTSWLATTAACFQGLDASDDGGESGRQQFSQAVGGCGRDAGHGCITQMRHLLEVTAHAGKEG
jgi:hypothetical protein